MRITLEGRVTSVSFYNGEEEKPYSTIEIKHPNPDKLPGFGTILHIEGLWRLGRKLFVVVSDLEPDLPTRSA